MFLDEAEIDRYNQQMGSTLGAGDIKYLNVSNMHGYGDDIVDVDDWTWIGNPTVPEIVYGFGPSFKYKNFFFFFFFQILELGLLFNLPGSSENFFVYEWIPSFRRQFTA